MKLARTRSVVGQIENNEAIKKIATSSRYFVHQEGEWIELYGDRVTDSTLKNYLTLTIGGSQPWRPRKSRSTYFPIADLQVVVVIEFAAAPKKGTYNRIHKRLGECAEAGINAFLADHDHLTDLLNRSAFDAALTKEVSLVAESPVPTESIPEELEAKGAIYVVAIDIDFFKQVNDTFGGNYPVDVPPGDR